MVLLGLDVAGQSWQLCPLRLIIQVEFWKTSGERRDPLWESAAPQTAISLALSVTFVLDCEDSRSLVAEASMSASKELPHNVWYSPCISSGSKQIACNRTDVTVRLRLLVDPVSLCCWQCSILFCSRSQAWLCSGGRCSCSEALGSDGLSHQLESLADRDS